MTNAGKALATTCWRRRSWFRLGTLPENGTVYKRHWRSVLTATRRLDVQAMGEEMGHICSSSLLLCFTNQHAVKGGGLPKTNKPTNHENHLRCVLYS